MARAVSGETGAASSIPLASPTKSGRWASKGMTSSGMDGSCPGGGVRGCIARGIVGGVVGIVASLMVGSVQTAEHEGQYRHERDGHRTQIEQLAHRQMPG